MTSACFFFAYIFEQFVSYMYFSKKFALRLSKKLVFLSYLISFVIQIGINFINIPYLNLVSFFVCNFIVSYICYCASGKQIVFNVLLLESLMVITELIFIYIITLLFKINLKDYSNNYALFVFETLGTKTLYFIFAYSVSLFSFKEKKDNPYKDYSYLLFFLPLTSVIILLSFVYVSINVDLNQTSNMLFTCISILLLIINIVVFLVHERIISTLTENTELQLEKQKNQINKDYYEDLERQYASSNILIHDIKRYLATIKGLSLQENSGNAIAEYIDSIYASNSIKMLRKYSENKLVNVIISRYAQLCNEANIEFFVDIRNVDLSFITNSDLTSLLDNLLENAYEAAEKSNVKEIALSLDNKNETYILINITNSSDNAPILKDSKIQTSKVNKRKHGIGLKSIERIVKKYHGNLEYTYDSDFCTFSTSVLLKKPLKIREQF